VKGFWSLTLYNEHHFFHPNEAYVGNATGNVLPLALGVAISPIPIIAVILMLLSPKAHTNGPAFLGPDGWRASRP
jgi:hypothetical protein